MNRRKIVGLTLIAASGYLITFGVVCLIKTGHVPGLRVIPAAEFKHWKPVPGTGGRLRLDPTRHSSDAGIR